MMHAYKFISIRETLKCKLAACILKTFPHICNHVKTVAEQNANAVCSVGQFTVYQLKVGYLQYMEEASSRFQKSLCLCIYMCTLSDEFEEAEGKPHSMFAFW